MVPVHGGRAAEVEGHGEDGGVVGQASVLDNVEVGAGNVVQDRLLAAKSAEEYVEDEHDKEEGVKAAENEGFSVD